jgi:hypothetical protein
MYSSPWQRLRKGEEDVATSFHAGVVSRCDSLGSPDFFRLAENCCLHQVDTVPPFLFPASAVQKADPCLYPHIYS